MPTDKQRLLEIETQFMYQDDMFKKMLHDIKSIKNIVTELHKEFKKIKIEAVQVKLIR